MQGASIEGDGAVHLLSLTGPGLSGDNITLALDPTGTSQPGYTWTGGVAAPGSSSGRGRAVLAPWQLALAIVFPVLGVLAAAGTACWWLGKHRRRAAAGGLCTACKLEPCRCCVTDGSSKSVPTCSKGGGSGGTTAAVAAAGDLAGLDGVRGRDQTHSTEGGVAVVSAGTAPSSNTSRADRKATYIANSLQNWKAAVSNTTMAIMQRRLDTGLDAAIASGSGGGSLPSPMVPPRKRLGLGSEGDHEGGTEAAGATAASAGSSGGLPASSQQQQQQPKLVELIGVGGFGSVYKGERGRVAPAACFARAWLTRMLQGVASEDIPAEQTCTWQLSPGDHLYC